MPGLENAHLLQQPPERPNYSPPLPPIYAVGTTLALRFLAEDTDDRVNYATRAVIEHAFLPLTKSQVFRVALAPDAGLHPVSLPSSAILKLYDRRYVDDREDRKWSPEVETAARRAWREKRSDLIQDVASYRDTPSFDETDDDAAVEDALWWKLQTRFRQEREAYDRLLPLQGRFIPRCYAAIQLEPSDEDKLVPEAAIYGLLLEDVGGVDLEHLVAEEHDLVSASHALLAALSTFPSYGVLHNDIRSPNILACPSAKTPQNRLILVDLGHAWLKGGELGHPEDKFDEYVEQEDEVGALRHILNSRRVRARTPHDTRFAAERNRHASNGYFVRYLPSKADVRRWYDELPREPDDPEPDPFKSKREVWRTKPAVLDWLATRPEGVEAFYVQRPGSPDEHVVSPELRVSPA